MVKYARLQPGLELDYVCLDYGIAALGTKGASVHMRSICRALTRNGNRIRLICTRTGGDTAALASTVTEVEEMQVPAELKEMQKGLRKVYGPQLRIPSELRQCLVNKHALEGLPAYWSLHRPDAVIERLSLFGVAGVRAADSAQIPHFLEVNALLSDEAKAFRSLNDYAAAQTAEDEVLRSTRKIFCVSAQLAQIIAARGIEEAKIVVVPNGFDSDLFRPRAATAFRKRTGIGTRFCIGTAGSLKSWHGVETLLKAYAMFAARRASRVTLVVIGDGPESSRVSEFQAAFPGLTVIATGAIDHHEVPQWLSACDVLTAPYDVSESFYFSPMKVFEYLAVRKPVIASDQGQITELIHHRETGLLFRAGCARELAECLTELYKKPRLREKLAINGHAMVQSFTWRNNANRIVQEIRRAI